MSSATAIGNPSGSAPGHRGWRLVGAVAVMALAGCATTPVAEFESATDADLSRYETFAFFEPLAMEREGFGTSAGERARAVLRREMESRGYRLDPENPALRINVIAAAQPERARPQFSLGLGMGVGGGNTRGGIGIGLPIGGGAQPTPSLGQPASLAIDLVDEQARRVVWTGSVAVERSGRTGYGAALEAALQRAMAGLPPRDGTSRADVVR